ncbi:MAG: glycine dehydrogenase [delta proteobacterium ML8_F1]|nr:MAG: glycine dehydrogenase [delta proteobacterium ML8_F1]
MFRYIPNGDEDRRNMMDYLGIKAIDELFTDIPEPLKFKGELKLDASKSEIEVLEYFEEKARANCNLTQLTSFLGAGVYDHYIPGIIKHMAGRGEFYTAYTPYQPEISQGTLQVIFEYQSMICDLTGLDVSNASMYDGPTAAAEALLMATTQKKKEKIILASAISPEIRQVVDTYMKYRDIEVVTIKEKEGLVDFEDLEAKLDGDAAAVLVQSPNFYGLVEDVQRVSELAHGQKALSIAYVDPISLGILKSPGEAGVDIAVGDGQSLGNGSNLGGPYLGFLATTDKLVRKMPGRIVGQTVDVDGKRSWVLTLQAREQHIRRYKATSNICSNQGLNALIASIYMTTLGKEGIKEVAASSLQKAHYAYDKLLATGRFKPAFKGPFFKEFVLLADVEPEVINKKLLENNILGGYDLSKACGLERGIMFAVTEKRTKAEIDRLAELLEVM